MNLSDLLIKIRQLDAARLKAHDDCMKYGAGSWSMDTQFYLEALPLLAEALSIFAEETAEGCLCHVDKVNCGAHILLNKIDALIAERLK